MFIPATLPLSPTGFRLVSASHDLLSLAWEPAEANVLHYIIVIREANKKKFKKIAKFDSSQLSCTLNTGFEDNQNYVLRIYAENEVHFTFPLACNRHKDIHSIHYLSSTSWTCIALPQLSMNFYCTYKFQ